MKLRMEKEPVIDNLRNHPSEMVENLRHLLTAGAPAQADPRRKNFYELENCTQVYYIHVSPSNNKVMLLAVWDKDGGARPVPDAEAALACCDAC
jgi:hypothetical protein